MNWTPYKVTLKEAPRARTTHEWIRYGSSTDQVARQLRDDTRRDMPELVVVNVEPTADPRRRPMAKCHDPAARQAAEKPEPVSDAAQIYRALHCSGQTVDVYEDELKSASYCLNIARQCLVAVGLYTDPADKAAARDCALEEMDKAASHAREAIDATPRDEEQDKARELLARINEAAAAVVEAQKK